MKEILKREKGITLIALVITIIVLLILAGVSIITLSGDNGMLTKATKARIENSCAQVYEALKLEEQNYQIEAKTGEIQEDIITYLQKKGIVDSVDNNIIVKVTKLLGKSSETGNGSGTKDVYKLEEVTTLGKIASTENVKIASTNTGKTYKVVYYNESEKRRELGSIADVTVFGSKEPVIVEPEPGHEDDWDVDIDAENNTATIRGYKGSDTTVVIPNYYNNVPVKKIEAKNLKYSPSIWSDDICSKDYFNWHASAMTYKQKTIKKIIISEGIEEIGKYAFMGSSALEEVTIPSSVTSIGNGAFYRCEQLKSVTIPSSVTSIGDNAFAFCTQLSSVAIPGSITSIENDTFYQCEQLKNVTIPSSVTSIGDNAFGYCTQLSSITIPNGVTSIGEWTFSGCTQLSSIMIPSSVTSIGNSAFRDCTQLSSITIPSSIISLGNAVFYRNSFNYSKCTIYKRRAATRRLGFRMELF